MKMIYKQLSMEYFSTQLNCYTCVSNRESFYKYVQLTSHALYLFVNPASSMEAGMLWFCRDSKSCNGVVKPRHINRLNGLENLKQHVRAGHPDPRRTLLAQTTDGIYQLINVRLHLCVLEVDSLVPRLTGGGVGHEGVATGTEWECGPLGEQGKGGKRERGRGRGDRGRGKEGHGTYEMSCRL